MGQRERVLHDPRPYHWLWLYTLDRILHVEGGGGTWLAICARPREKSNGSFGKPSNKDHQRMMVDPMFMIV